MTDAVALSRASQVCERDLRRVLLEADTQRHIGVPVSLIDIASRSPSAAEALLSSPRHALPLLERALITAQARGAGAACIAALLHMAMFVDDGQY